MASDDDIRNGISAAHAVEITPADMVAVLDRAIMSAFISSDAAGAVAIGLPAVTYTVAGRSRTISLTEAKDLRKFYASQVGIVAQSVELWDL